MFKSFFVDSVSCFRHQKKEQKILTFDYALFSTNAYRQFGGYDLSCDTHPERV